MSYECFKVNDNLEIVFEKDVKFGDYHIKHDTGEILLNDVPITFSGGLPSEIILHESYNEAKVPYESTITGYTTSVGPIPMRKTILDFEYHHTDTVDQFEPFNIQVLFEPPVIHNENIDFATLDCLCATIFDGEVHTEEAPNSQRTDIMTYDPAMNVFVYNISTVANLNGVFNGTFPGDGGGGDTGDNMLRYIIEVIPMIMLN